jgi:hypothetical protein
MNEQRIEEMLLDMPLAEPSAELDDRVLGMDEADRSRFRLVGWTSGLSGLAAGLAVAGGDLGCDADHARSADHRARAGAFRRVGRRWGDEGR